MANTLNQYLRRLSLHHIATSAHHPRTNGKNEKLNGLLGSNTLPSVFKGARHRWDQFLDEAPLSCRVKTNSRTGVSPFELVYGIKPRLPGDIGRPFLWNLDNTADFEAYSRIVREQLGFTRQQNYLEQARVAGATAELYDKDVARLAEGELVLVRRENKLKFENAFDGPFKVRRVCPFGTYQLYSPDGAIHKVLYHRDRLKLWKGTAPAFAEPRHIDDYPRRSPIRRSPPISHQSARSRSIRAISATHSRSSRAQPSTTDTIVRPPYRPTTPNGTPRLRFAPRIPTRRVGK